MLWGGNVCDSSRAPLTALYNLFVLTINMVTSCSSGLVVLKTKPLHAARLQRVIAPGAMSIPTLQSRGLLQMTTVAEPRSTNCSGVTRRGIWGCSTPSSPEIPKF